MLDTQSDSNGQLLHSLATRYGVELPAFVKDATIRTVSAPPATPASLFADPVARLFPCHTKEATLLSSLYLFGQKADGAGYPDRGVGFDLAADKLVKAATYWGIRDDVAAVRARIEKVAAAQAETTDADFALVVEYAGQRTRELPIRTPALLQKSASLLFAKRRQYPYLWRKQAAANILSRAYASGINIEDQDAYLYLVKASGVSPRDNWEAAKQLSQYAYTYKHQENKEHVKAAAKVLADNPEADVGALCTCIDMINRQGRYEREVPEAILFSGPPAKEAAMGPTIELRNGKSYPLSAIKAAGLEPILAVCGDAVAGAVSDVVGGFDVEKAAEVLPTLPSDMAEGLCALYAKSAGLRPLDPIEKAAMVGRRKKGVNSRADKYLDVQEWKKLAESMNLKADASPCWTMTMTLKS